MVAAPIAPADMTIDVQAVGCGGAVATTVVAPQVEVLRHRRPAGIHGRLARLLRALRCWSRTNGPFDENTKRGHIFVSPNPLQHFSLYFGWRSDDFLGLILISLCQP